MSIFVVGDNYLWQTLKAGKQLLKLKQYAEALKLFEDAKRYCERNNWGTNDEEIARALVGLGRTSEAISLLEGHLHEHGGCGTCAAGSMVTPGTSRRRRRTCTGPGRSA